MKVTTKEQLERMMVESEWSLKLLGKVTERTKLQVEGMEDDRQNLLTDCPKQRIRARKIDLSQLKTFVVESKDEI